MFVPARKIGRRCEIKPELTGKSQVVSYNMSSEKQTIEDGKFIQTGCLNKPPAVLMTGVSKLQALHLRKRSAIQKYVNSMLELNPAMQQKFSCQNPEDNQLFQADYDHMDSDKDCKSCDEERLVQ